jgi:branched-chain amino acid aminotransferase
VSVASVGAPADLGVVSWVDGELIAPGATAFRPEDKGLVGDGVFEAIKVIDGQPFALHRHLERLLVSARPLGLAVDLDVVRSGIASVLETEVGRGPRSWLRITVTAGPAGMAKGGDAGPPTVMVATAAMAPWEAAANVVVLPWCRNERGALTGLKTLSYLENGMAVRHALRHGADEGIFANTIGKLCEGSGTNVFLVHDGRLVTPPLSAGCLAGVTRGLLLEWMPDIAEVDVPIEALAHCSEAFLTSTSRDVHPIGAVDGRRLPSSPGPSTAASMAIFAERAAADPDP